MNIYNGYHSKKESKIIVERFFLIRRIAKIVFFDYNSMETYIDKLITNIPNTDYGNINLILDGGAFSGSYILGTLYYIKRMETIGRMKVDKMSGCSIGSILCILYLLNDLDYCNEVYSRIRNYFKEHGNLHVITSIMKDLQKRLPKGFYKRCNDKIYLSYYDIGNNKHIVQSQYKCNRDLINVMLKSSYIPFICGQEVLHKKQYLDGLKPHVFTEGKTLFVNLCMDYKCLVGMLNIRNEINNMERILCGILDIHSFFLNKKSTNMCYFLDNMAYSHKILYFVRVIIIQSIVCLYHAFYKLYQSLKTHPEFPKYMKTLNIGKKYTKKIIYAFMKFFMV